MPKRRTSNRVKILTKNKDPYLYEFYYFGSQYDIISQLNVALPSFMKLRLQTSAKNMSQTFSKAMSNPKLMNQLKEEYRPLREALQKDRGQDAVLMWNRKEYKFVTSMLMSSLFVKVIREMSLVYLVAEFESFLGNILKLTFDTRPEILSSSQKTMTFEELVKINNISEVRLRLIEKEVHNVLCLDIDEIGVYFKQKFNVDLSRFVDWKKLTEMFYRRHVIVHNSGIASKTYALKTNSTLEGKQLSVTETYLKGCLELFFKTALVITLCLRSKLSESRKDENLRKRSRYNKKQTQPNDTSVRPI